METGQKEHKERARIKLRRCSQGLKSFLMFLNKYVNNESKFRNISMICMYACI